MPSYIPPPAPIAAPATPDYMGAATKQGQQNLQAGQQTTQISNPNIINPYGSQTVTYDASGVPTVNQSLSTAGQSQLNAANTLGAAGIDRISQMTAPDLTSYQFSGVDPFSMGNAPEIRQIDTSKLQKVGPLTTEGLFDLSPINTQNLYQRTTMPTAAGQSAVAEAMRQREAPRFERARSSAENDLLVRGFNPGTQGYDARMDELSRAENDFNLGLTALSGQEQSRLFNLEGALRGEGLGEQLAQTGSEQAVRGQLFGERGSIANFEKSLRDQGLNEQQVAAQVAQATRAQALSEAIAKAQAQETARAREVQEAITGRQLPIQEYAMIQDALQPAMPQFQQFTGANVDAAPVFDATTQQGLFDLSRYGTQADEALARYGIEAEQVMARNQRKANESASKRQGWIDLASSIAGFAGGK